MKCKGAVIYGTNQEFVVDEITVDDPKEHEIMIKVAACGICHSDYHLVTGTYGDLYYPILAGHEGTGTVVKVGSEVTRFQEGDRVLMSFIPACGHCTWCSGGESFFCDNGAYTMRGPQLEGTFRVHDKNGMDVGQFCLLGAFSEYTVIPEISAIKLEPGLDLNSVSIMGCAVPTGFGSSVNKADVQPGETVAIYGVGGIGIFALQGAVVKGAAKVIAIDPVDFKLEKAKEMGATHVINPTREDPVEKIMEITYGVGAHKGVIAIGEPTPEDIGKAFDSICKGGRLVVTGVADIKYDSIKFGPWWLTQYAKEVVGCLYGNSPFFADIPRYLELYKAGKLKVDEAITRTYKLDQINEGFRDMLDGKNVRGVIVYD